MMANYPTAQRHSKVDTLVNLGEESATDSLVPDRTYDGNDGNFNFLSV